MTRSRELFVTPTSGGELLKLNPPLQPGTDEVLRFQLLNNNRLIFSMGRNVETRAIYTLFIPEPSGLLLAILFAVQATFIYPRARRKPSA